MVARKRAKKNAAKRRRAKRKGLCEKQAQSPRSDSNAGAMDRLRNWLLPNAGIFAGLGLHGNTSWSPSALVWLALCWAWSESRNVTDAFDEATRQCKQLGVAALSTYQGFLNALVTWTNPILSLMWPVLHQRMRQIGGSFYEVGGWVPIAFDGSRSSAPRTRSNEKTLCAANYGTGQTAKYRKKKTKNMRRRKNEKNKPQPQVPQVWITLLWHMGMRLPWTWRLGPSNSSERAHVMQMLDDGDFPENTLFCGDAGFVGYPLWSHILDHGHHFLVRVGANVHLLSESANYKIGNDGRVLCWPQDAIQAGAPPLRLRLVKITIGKAKMWMLTSVAAPSKLPKKQIVRLYKMRWGIEVEFRGLKQTLGRAKLRCRNDRRVLAELNWSILAMAVAELFALKEQLAPPRSKTKADDPPADPQKRSLANTMRALRRCLNEPTQTPEPGHDLRSRLRLAVTDSYHRKRSKKARYRPPNPDKKPLGDPNLRELNQQEREQLNAIPPEKTAA